jgi:replicative DNA helicase
VASKEDGVSDDQLADDEDAQERSRLEHLFAVADDDIAAGFDVLPAAVWLKDDGTLDKAPLLAHGHLQAHRDRQLIRQQLVDPPHVPKEVPKDFEVVVGFRPGSGGCGVLDCDVKHGKAGEAAYRALVAEHGEFVDSAWRSPSGGVNILFRKPLGQAYGNHSPWPGIDVRADGGWVVSPGNTCVGGTWRWVVGGLAAAGPLPEAMTAKLESADQHTRRASNADTVAFIQASPEGSTIPASEGFKAKLADFAQAGLGSRHDALKYIVGWACGMKALDLRWAWDEIGRTWLVLTAGEGRSDEMAEMFAWTVGQEQKNRAQASDSAGQAKEPPTTGWRGLILDGKTWLRSGSAVVETVWGDQRDALLPRLQPSLIVGDTGAGKTTLAQHVILGAIGVTAFADVLGWPVRVLPDGERVLYLASDRPDQARIAMLRYFGPGDTAAWKLLEDRLRVWRGPPPESLAKSPGLLLEMAEESSAGLVVIDSTKDVAIKLSDDAVGAAVNQAHQLLVAADRALIALHHPRKRGREFASERPTLDDVYGSAWLSNGAGSVLFLIEEPQSTEVLQLKTPNGRQSNFRFRIDTATGLLAITTDSILDAVTVAGAAGISTKQVTVQVSGVADPSEAQIARIRRRLKVLEATGSITQSGTGKQSRWVVP